LIILHRNVADIARDLRAEWCEIGLQIGVICALFGSLAFPAVPLRDEDDQMASPKLKARQTVPGMRARCLPDSRARGAGGLGGTIQTSWFTGDGGIRQGTVTIATSTRSQDQKTARGG
jgi:hypothetical protein